MLEVELWTEEHQTGSLFFDAANLRQVTSVVPDTIWVSHETSSQYSEAKKLIEAAYGRRFRSAIRHHYPMLLSVQGQNGRILAAVGIRRADEEVLFLEQYLHAPVERSIAEATGATVGRDKIVEIGNLASTGRGASAVLFMVLAAYLKRREFAFAAVTATKQLRTAFNRFGFTWATLGRAVPNALPDNGASWGTYYQCEPEVLVGEIAPCLSRLEKFLPCDRNRNVSEFCPQIRSPMPGIAE